MWERPFHDMARRMIRTGQLDITYPDGRQRRYGDGWGPRAAIQLRSRAVVRRLCLQPELALGEGYMDGTIGIGGNAELEALLAVLIRNRDPGRFPLYLRAVDRLREEFGVYLVRSGRMCVAGLNTGNVERTARALAAVMA